jgi:MFS family permease
MYKLLLKSKKINVLTYIYIATLFLSFHYYLTTYINSSFLQQFIGEKSIGLIYAISGAISICLFLLSSRFLERFGNYKMMIWIYWLDIILLFLLVLSKDIFWVITIFTIHNSINPIMILNLDNLLENTSKNEEVGRVRGIFLTVMSMIGVISPVIVGSILVEGNFKTVYALSAIALLPLIYITARYFKKVKDDNFHHIHIGNGIQTFIKDKNIRNIYISNLILQIFYSWVVIYVPIYLYEQIGFNWQQLGLMISIALLPFVLLEIPIGNIADKKLGEKELLITGFIISALGLLAMSSITSADFLIWTGILFVSRIGASLMEVTTESYFFKKINSSNQNLIGAFRTAGPLGYIIGPIIGSFLLIFLDYRYIFAVFGIIILLSVRFAFKIKDTK